MRLQTRLFWPLASILAGPVYMAAGVCTAYAQAPLDQTSSATLPSIVIATPPPLAVRPKVEVEYQAQPTAAPRIEGKDGIFIGAINVEGAPNLPASVFSNAIEPFLGKNLGTAELSALCRAIAEVARARGYGFSTAYIPPQELSLGMLRVRADEGVISAVRISGSGNKQLKRTLEQLVGRAATSREVEDQVLRASDIPGITLSKIRFAREGDRGILLVEAKENKIRAAIRADNFGSEALGPTHLTLSVDYASLVTDGDVLTVAGVVSPLQPKELGFAVLKYALPIDADGTVVTFSASHGRTQPGGVLRQFDVRGQSNDLALSIARPLMRNRNASLWIGGGIEYLESRQSFLGSALTDDRLSTIWLSLYGDTALLRGRLHSEFTLTRGLDIFGATLVGDPLATRGDAGGIFTKVNFSADWAGSLYGPIGLRLAMMAQATNRPLLVEHEIGVGGPSFGRAFEYGERTADKGVLGLAELRGSFDKPTPWLDWLQPYAFFDGGYVRNLGVSQGSSLYSAGGGLRSRLGTTFLNVESAMPVNAIRGDSGDKSPRWRLQLTKTF